MQQPKLIPLHCVSQNYAWGKVGNDSVIAQVLSKTPPPGFAVDESLPYAELWMGTHPSAPSVAAPKGVPDTSLLSEFIKGTPGMVTDKITERWPGCANGELPFLFKILSIAKALSIQAHPDLELAPKLHARDPKNYKDPNHKPELTVAVTDFEALCGFRPLPDIANLFDKFPELAKLAGENNVAEFKRVAGNSGEEGKKALKAAFSQVMKTEQSVVDSSVDKLISRLKAKGDGADELERLLIRLDEQFPHDIGLFSSLFLNHVHLKPGDALFLAANLPHAYISGNCVEIMACSDNVVRAGLTPKFKDVETLTEMLTYENGAPNVLKGETVDDHTVRYRPPIQEFKLDRISLTKGEAHDLTTANDSGCAILLVYDGSGSLTEAGDNRLHIINTGAVYFVGANAHFTLKANSDVLAFLATANL